MITHQELLEAFEYHSETGIFYRRLKSGKTKMSGWVLDTGYVQLKYNNIKYRAHRVAWLYVTGSFPDGEIDHINHVRNDNRICNLRDVSRRENSRNCGLLPRNKSGVVGVYFDGVNRKWRAQIKTESKVLSLGSFKDKHDAASARKAAEIKYGFHTNHGGY